METRPKRGFALNLFCAAALNHNLRFHKAGKIGKRAMETRNKREIAADKVQLMLTEEELEIIDNWRADHRAPSRAAALREILRRGLLAAGAGDSEKSIAAATRAAACCD